MLKQLGNFLIAFVFFSCSQTTEHLPILGPREAIPKTINGKKVVDTLYHTIPNFAFVNQYGDTITQDSIKNKIYIADFFFTTCPTICPVMSKQMLKIYQKIKKQSDIAILSHTIDPQHDTPEVLRQYATDLGVENNNQWHFLTGKREAIYAIGEKQYLVTAGQDASAPGGYIHSGAFILIDKHSRIRGLYDGTKQESTEKLLHDIELLRQEK